MGLLEIKVQLEKKEKKDALVVLEPRVTLAPLDRLVLKVLLDLLDLLVLKEILVLKALLAPLVL